MRDRLLQHDYFFFALDPQSSSSSSHLKNASFSQCLKITLKKVSFCNIAKFIFGEKLNQINSLIKIRENIIVLQCLVVDNFDRENCGNYFVEKFVKRQQFYTGFSF